MDKQGLIKRLLSNSLKRAMLDDRREDRVQELIRWFYRYFDPDGPFANPKWLTYHAAELALYCVGAADEIARLRSALADANTLHGCAVEWAAKVTRERDAAREALESVNRVARNFGPAVQVAIALAQEEPER